MIKWNIIDIGYWYMCSIGLEIEKFKMIYIEWVIFNNWIIE